MTEQLGFGFLPDSKPTYRELPAGGWHSPCFTVNEYEARLERARIYLPSVMWAAREIYKQGLEAARESFDRALDNGQARDAEAREWPRLTLQVESTQRTEFVGHCISMVDGEWDSPGLEFKVSAHKYLTRVGMYCCETGSVVVTTWADGLVGVDFAIGRDPFFLPSFREGQRVIHAPHFEHERYDCGGEFVGLRDGVTDVPIVTVEGRDYVADGGEGASRLPKDSSLEFLLARGMGRADVQRSGSIQGLGRRAHRTRGSAGTGSQGTRPGRCFGCAGDDGRRKGCGGEF